MAIEHPTLSTIDPTFGQRRRAFALSLLMVCGCILALPLSGTHMPRIDGFVLVADTTLALLSLVTAFLLFSQMALVRSRALLVMACGFLLVGLTTLPQLVRLAEGAAPDPALRYFSDLCLPIAVIVFVVLERRPSAPLPRVSSWVVRGVTITFAVAALAIWISSAAQDPEDQITRSISWQTTAAVMLTAITGVALLLVRRRRASLLDLWLQVALTAWLIGVLLEGLAPDGMSFAWYLGQFYGLLGVTCMTLSLLAENAGLFVRISGWMAVHERRHDDEYGNSRPGGNAAVEAIADELGQPLCAISANVDAVKRMLERPPADMHEIHAALTDIGSDVHRASEIMRHAQRLLGVLHEPPSVVDMGQLVDECLRQLRPEMLLHRVTCEVETAARLPAVHGFRRQLLQLLTNLVSNSLEAMSLQSGERRLKVRASRHDACAIAIWIEDSGKPHRTGPGIAICHAIATAHGGHISLGRRDGQGAAFQVILPAGS